MRHLRLAVVTLLLLAAPALASAQIAILDSASTRDYFALHYAGCTAPGFYLPDGQEYQRYFRGWEFVLQEMGLPYDIITDDDIASGALSSYSLLILSNTVSISDAETKAIDHWTRRGGHLIATFGSSYKSIAIDQREADQLKKQKGGTAGLHDLWHDPLSKAVTSQTIAPSVDVAVTRFTGPTAGLQVVLDGGWLPYGAFANLLTHRPPQKKDVLAWLMLPDGTVSNYPAIISTGAAHGWTVYFAFAPEYLVSKEFGLPPWIPCDDGQNWSGRSEDLRAVMRSTISFMLH